MTQMREKTSAEDLQHRAQWKNLHLYHYKKTPYAVCSRYVYIIVCYTRMFIYIFKNHCIPLYNHIIILRTYLYLYIYIYIYVHTYIYILHMLLYWDVLVNIFCPLPVMIARGSVTCGQFHWENDDQWMEWDPVSHPYCWLVIQIHAMRYP